MSINDWLELSALTVGVVSVVISNFQYQKIMLERFESFKEVCKLRHNPVDEDLKHIKQQIDKLIDHQIKSN